MLLFPSPRNVPLTLSFSLRTVKSFLSSRSIPLSPSDADFEVGPFARFTCFFFPLPAQALFDGGKSTSLSDSSCFLSEDPLEAPGSLYRSLFPRLVTFPPLLGDKEFSKEQEIQVRRLNRTSSPQKIFLWEAGSFFPLPRRRACLYTQIGSIPIAD